jgi:sulfur-oxidizing protein SoxZ
VSRDPYFSFSFSGAKAGDTLAVRWVDNLGETDSVEAVLG